MHSYSYKTSLLNRHSREGNPLPSEYGMKKSLSKKSFQTRVGVKGILVKCMHEGTPNRRSVLLPQTSTRSWAKLLEWKVFA